MSETRKHPATYACAVRLHCGDIGTLFEAMLDRRYATLTLDLREDENGPNLDWVSYTVRYGPVRGANRHDVTKFFDRLGIGYALSDRGQTTYACKCVRRSEPCLAEVDLDSVEPYVWTPSRSYRAHRAQLGLDTHIQNHWL